MGPHPGGPVIEAYSRWVEGLRPSGGNNWVGFCPLHGEIPGKSKPSFSVHAETGLWHCFAGCGGGGLPKFLKTLGRSPDYIDRTVSRLGTSLKKAPKKAVTARTTGLFLAPYVLPEKLLGLWQFVPETLLEPDTALTEEVLFDHDIGFDPQLQRITFPIRDLVGNLAGVMGKPTGPGARGKYLVYEQEIRNLDFGLAYKGVFKDYKFENHRFLWRWDRIYPELGQTDTPRPVYIVEGFKAALWMVQHGLEHTMALMGSSVSDTQKLFLERLGMPVVLCLDDDNAGRSGTAKACYRLRGLKISVMRYPFPGFNLQPDDLTQNELHEAVLNPYSVLQWRRQYGIPRRRSRKRTE